MINYTNECVIWYLQFTSSISCFSVIPAELFALHVYDPASALLIELKFSVAVLEPEFFTLPLWIQLTYGTGLPEVLQLTLTASLSR